MGRATPQTHYPTTTPIIGVGVVVVGCLVDLVRWGTSRRREFVSGRSFETSRRLEVVPFGPTSPDIGTVCRSFEGLSRLKSVPLGCRDTVAKLDVPVIRNFTST